MRATAGTFVKLNCYSCTAAKVLYRPTARTKIDPVQNL
eukprot:SAG11_NODE_32442_length_278_cov_1.239130_1_plen_37_part_01